ncbi:MAG: ATPase, T2SS/T4P/T4SS family, partial [Candidatus Binatia bacterium]
MIELHIEGGPSPETRVERFDREEISIGRAAGNDLVLPHTTVSSRHARIFRENGGWLVSDQGSTNGTLLNGAPVTSPAPVTEGDEIEVGEFRLSIRMPAAEAAGRRAEAEEESVPTAPADVVKALRDRVHKRLLEFLDLRWVDLSKLSEDEVRKQTRQTVENVLRELAWEIPAGVNREVFIKEVIDEALGLGPLEDLLADADVSEIMVNRADQIYIERKGKLTLSDKRFSSDKAVLHAIERIVAPIGRRIDESSPMVDARLKDGSRVNAIIPPLALDGPSL